MLTPQSIHVNGSHAKKGPRWVVLYHAGSVKPIMQKRALTNTSQSCYPYFPTNLFDSVSAAVYNLGPWCPLQLINQQWWTEKESAGQWCFFFFFLSRRLWAAPSQSERKIQWCTQLCRWRGRLKECRFRHPPRAGATIPLSRGRGGF